MTTTTSIPHTVRQRLTGLLFLSQSLYSAATIASFTLLPIIAVSLSGRESMAGVPSTVVLVGRASFAYLAGLFMDRVGRRLGLSLGHGVGAVGATIIAISIGAGSFIGLCVGACLMGMGRGAVDLGRYAAAEIHTMDRRAKVIGLVVFGGTIGAVGGPLLVSPSSALALQYELVDSMGPYIAAALLNFVGMVLLFAFLVPDPLKVSRLLATAQSEKEAKQVKRPLRYILGNRRVQLAIGSMVIGQLVMTLIMVITPLHMSHHNHSTEAISGVIMAHTLGMFGLSGVTGWLVDRFGRFVMMGSGSLILIVAALLTPLSTAVTLLAVSLFLLGLGWNFCFVAGSSLLTDSLQTNERGQVQGVSDMLVSLASGAGSLSTGVIFEQWGIVAVCTIGLFFAFLLISSTAWSTYRQPVQASG